MRTVVGSEATLSAAKNFLVHDAICHDFALIGDKGRRTQKEKEERVMKSAKHILSSFSMLLLFCWSINAQQTSSSTGSATVPRLVNFSGKATDTQGKNISGIAGATFAIYKEESGGSPLWLETQNIQADAKGNYTAQLGATKADGLPLDLFSSGEARWLGVTVNGGQEQPRVLLLSVPYALKAADAETIGGLPASAFVLAGKAKDRRQAQRLRPQVRRPPRMQLPRPTLRSRARAWSISFPCGIRPAISSIR
jgi:hypothetical protein